VTPKPPSWPATLQTFALVVSLKLGLRHIWSHNVNFHSKHVTIYVAPFLGSYVFLFLKELDGILSGSF
jgi:hypothetical protein